MGKKLHGKILFLLFLFPVIAWGQCPSSLSISSDTGTTICEGTAVTFTASIPNGSYGTLSYDWKLNGSSSGTGTSFSSSNLQGGDVIQLIITSTEVDGVTTCSKSSNTLQMTVNQNRTGSVTIQASNSNICPGETVDFSIASISNAGSGATYSWKVNNTVAQTSNNDSFSQVLSDGDIVSLDVISSIPCTPDFSSTNTITISEKAGTPGQPSSINGDAIVCPGISKTYSVTNDSTVSEYIWTLPSGWSGSSSSNTINVTTGNSSGDISVVAKNDCGTSITRSISVTSSPAAPNIPGTISGVSSVCPGVSQTYTIGAVTNATEYIWNFPSGWNNNNTTVTTNSPSIDVTTGATGNNGNISVVASNNCGDSSARTLSVSVKPGTPNTPGVMAGQGVLCPGITETYTVAAVSGATSYIWTLPDGFSAPSLTTSNPNIDVTAGTSGSGTITVSASNDCGTSSGVASKTLTISNPAPIMTGSITGSTEVCANTTGHTYSIPAITNATSYTWTATSGLTISSGQGTNTITVNAGSSGGNLSVIAKNNCGDSSSQSITVSLNDPAPVMSGSISGPTEVCKESTDLEYSIPAITNATEYVWKVPDGWEISEPKNTRTIKVSTPSTTSSNNTISVIAKNSCGSSASTSISVTSSNNVPAQPGDISTDLPSTAICPPANGYKFWVPAASGVTYKWYVPNGFEIVSGSGTNEITVNVSSNTSYGNNLKVEVEAINSCGPSTRKEYSNINIDSFVVADLGVDQTFCSATTTLNLTGYVSFGSSDAKLKVNSIQTTGTNLVQGLPTGKVNAFTYEYTPSTQDLAEGQVTFILNTEKPAGACQAGTDNMTVYFRPVPTVSITTNSPICAGQTSTVTFTGTPETSVTYRVGSSTTDQTIDIGASGTAELTSAVLNSTTTYNLRSIAYTATPNCSVTNLTGTSTVTVTQIPTAAISYNQPFCTSLSTPQDVTLTGTNSYAGGTFSAPAGLSIDASTGAITPSTSTPDTYTVTYTIPAKDGCEAVETTTEVSIQAKSVITSQPSSVRICEGGDAQFEVQATGESLTYQWYHNSVAAGNEVSNGTEPILNLTGVTASQAGSYIVVIGNTASCENVTSTPADLTVDQDIVINSQPISATVCTSDNTSLQVIATTGDSSLDNNLSYQWYIGTPGSGNPITGANSNELPLNNVDINDTGNYYVEISGPAEFECQSIVSDVAEFIVRETPTVEISGDAAICDGGSAEIYFTNGLANTVVTYSLNNNNTDLQTIALDDSGQAVMNTGALVATSNLETDFNYEIISVAYADDPTCSNEVTGTATVTVAPNPSVTMAFSGDQVEFCTQDGDTYTPDLTGSGSFSGGTFSATGGLNIDPSNGSFSPAANPADDYTINYTIPAYGGCPEEVNSLDIHIYEEVVITSEPFNVGICSTNDAEFSVVASGDDLKYQWYKVVDNPDILSGVSETNDILLNGETSATLSLQVATSVDAGDYYVKIAGTNACTPSDETQVNSEVVSLNVDEDITILEPAENVRVCEDSSQSVEFKFVAHADGAPLLFEWIYADGTPVNVNGNDPEGRYISVVDQVSNYQNSGIDVYVGTLKINNIVVGDQNSYAVRIDGSANNFTCPEAISNSFDLDVDPLPNKPVVEPIAYCVGDEAIALTATGETGATLMWYTSPTDPSPTETAPVPSTELVGTTSYFVTQKDAYCESEMAELVVTVNALPAAPPLSTEEQNITYCLGSEAIALSATSSGTDYTINWYGPNNVETPLTSAPIPPTNNDGEIYYWVSQTDGNTCESEKVMITVDVINLPDVTITNSGEETICEGDSVTLTATDANDTNSPGTEFVWTWEVDGESATGFEQTFSPTTTTVYTVTATNDNGCINTKQITINVDDAPVGGIISGPSSVCESDPSGSLDLTGHSGIIDRWEIKTASSSDWTAISETTPDANYQFSGLTETTSFRAILTNGVCEEVASSEITINIDPLPVAGGVLFNSPVGLNRVFMMCEFPSEDYLVPLQLDGTYVGDIISWQYRRNSQTVWTEIKNSDNTNYTGDVLSGAQVNAASGNESTLFRVEVGSGACTPNVYSDYATLSVIPSDIAPSPVQFSPGSICLGDIVTLSSGTGYGGSGTFEGGAFDNSSIANHGWRVMRFDDQTEYTFESAADNVRPDRWMRTNPHEYLMANPNGNGTTIYQEFDSCSCEEGNKGFAIVSGNNPSTLETPIFDLYTMDNPTLTFDQAYNLTYGDVIRVEISTDGGNNYTEEPLMEISGPAEPGGTPVTSGFYDTFGDEGPGDRINNKIEIDLSKYAGLGNLRIRWLYDGTDGGIYTIDEIGIPQDPQNVQLIWYYDDNINDPDNALVQIGEINQATVTYTPTKIGWNDFEVQTALVFDTNGDPCESAENSAVASVYVFDSYESAATSNVGECGNTDVQLSATITGAHQGAITEFPLGEGSTVQWEVVESPEGYTYSDTHFVNSDPDLPAIEDPNAIFQPPIEGNYKLRWTITPSETQTTRDIMGTMVTEDVPANPCPMTHIDADFEFIDCTTLDFDGVDDYIDLETNYAGNYFIEAWIRPFDRPHPDGGNTDASTGTIISGPGFEIKMQNLPANIVPNGRWYHIAVSNNGNLWVDGISSGSITITGNGANKTIIGARWNSNENTTENHFSGWIEEVRIWKVNLTEKQIRFMMNQRLKLDASGTVVSPLQGEVVPNLVIADGGLSSYYTDGTNNLDQDGVPFYNISTNDLAGYYRLYSDEPDPANLLPGYFDNALEPVNGYTMDHSINKVPGRLYNITTNQENTSPTPYFDDITKTGQDWETDNTWARPDVWDSPNGLGIDGTTQIDWNIARINTVINSGDKDIIMLGLLSGSGLLNIEPDHYLRITHYLLLNGNIDLMGESQLLQDHGSILDNTSSGWAEIEQEGRMSSYNYNYWTSPFSIQGADNNSGFMLTEVKMDGTDPNNPQPISFQDGYFVADGAKTNPITISNEWIWDFRGGNADIYGDWLHLGSDFLEIVGAGYSMKGTTGAASLSAKQNYVFRGKPNNGNIPVDELYLQNDQNFLVGNPFPSAIDATQFLKDNLINVGTGSGNNENGENVFNGTLYYWDHFAGFTHILEEYIGGYATYTLAGSAPAISNDWRINSGGGSNNIVPEQFIPVAQGFFLNSAPVSGQNFAGDIIFKNTQRVYETISGGSSIFLQQEGEKTKGKSNTGTNSEDNRIKIRVKFESPKGYYRQILVTRDDNTSNGFDIGYDAPLIEDNIEDMYWWFNENGFVIQGVPSFEKEQVLPLAIKTNAGGEFKIKIDETENWPGGKELYLKDKILDTVHDILEQPYVGTTEKVGVITDRFEIVFFNGQTELDPDTIDPELPVIDDLVGISYSTFSRQVKISNFDLLEVEKVMVFDMGGKLIQIFDELPTEEEIRLGMQPVRSGIYIVKVFSEKGISNKKIIIK